MLKEIILILIFTNLFSFNKQVEIAYICGNKGAKKYHFSETCRGLKACTHEIFKTDVKSAEKLGLELCGWED